MKRGWLRWTIRILSAAVLSLLLGLGLLHTPPVQRLAFNQLRMLLRSSSKIDIRASEFRFNLFRRDVTLTNLTVQSTDAPDLPPIFQAERIHIKPDIRQIVKGFWDFEELQIERPQIRCFIGPDGKSNVPGAGKSSGRTPDYLIAHGEVRDGSFQYEDVRRKIAVSFPKWRFLIEGDAGTRAHRIDFSSLGQSSLRYGARTIPVDQLKVAATLKKSDLRLQSAYLAAVRSRISLKGSVHDFSSPELDLQINPALDLNAIGRAAGTAGPLEGFLAGTIRATGKLTDLQIDARVRGTDITAADYRRVGFDLRSRAEWNAGRLRLRDVEIDSPSGSVRGSAELSMEPGRQSGSIEASLRDFDLFPVWKLIHPPFDLASRSTGDVSIRWKGPFSPSRFAGWARLNLAATRPTTSLHVLPLSGTVDAQLQPGRISGNLQSIAAMAAQISGPFSLQSFKEIEGNFQGGASDVDAVITQVSRFLGGGDNPLGAMRLAGPIQFSAHASGKLSHPAVDVSAESSALQSGVFKHLGTKIDAAVRGSQISFQNALALPHRSAIFAKGAFELGGPEPRLALDVYGDNIRAAAVGAMLDLPAPMSGDLKVEAHINGPFNDLTGQVSLNGEALSAYREPLGRLDADLQLAGKEVRSTRITLTRDPQNPDSDRVDASASYAFDTEQFRFQITGKDLRWRRLALPDGSPVQGVMHLAASGSGTVDQPSIDAKIESGDIRIRGWSLGPVSLGAALRDGRIAVDAKAPRFNASATAHIINETPYPFDGEVRVEKADLSRIGLRTANEEAVTGTLGAGIKGSGNLKDPAQAHVTAQIRELRLQAGDRELHMNPATAEYRDRSLEIPSATLVSGNSKLEFSGRVPLLQPAPSGALTLKGQIDLAQAIGFVPESKGIAASGTMNVDLTFTGTPQNLSPDGSILLQSGTLQTADLQPPLTAISLRAAVRGDSLVLEQADALWGPGKIELKGEFPFGLLPKNLPVQFPRKQGPASFTLDMTGIRPEVTGRLPQGVSGLISLHAAGEAGAPNLRALKANIDFRELSFRMNELSLSQKQPSAIAVQNGIASISRLSFSGTETSIDASGSASLLPDGRLDLRVTGDLNAALLTFMSRDLKASGRLKVEVGVAGNRNAPSLSGTAQMKGGKLSLRSPRVIADSLTVKLVLDPKKISVGEFKGTLNGGPLSVTGDIGYGRQGLSDVNLKASVQDFFINFPEGLKSSSSGDLTITSPEDTILVSGNVRVQESSYREPFGVSSQLMSYLKGQQVLVTGQESDALLDRVRLNISLRTETPTLVQNNIAKVEGSANLRLVGPFSDPSMVGRVTLGEGGEIVLNQRTYYIDQGTITFANETKLEPQLDIQAETKTGDYEVTLHLTGTPERLSTTLTSEPSLSEPDIISLLLTGQTTSETQGREFQMARTQALTLIAGQAGEELTGEARRALHLSTFRIDPGLIASESDPGARLTLGQDVTNNLSLIYSMNLTNGGDQIWAAQYEIIRRLTTQATKQQDNSYRFEFHHDLVFGGARTTRRARTPVKKFEIGAIRFEGGDGVSDKTLLDNFGVKSGQKFDFPKVQKGLDRLHQFYFRENRFEANIRLHRETLENTVDLNLNIDPGPVVEFAYEGAPISPDVKDAVEKAWTSGVFDIERIEDAVRAIRMPLLRAGYLQAKINHKIETEGDKKIIRFQIDAGTRYSGVPILFPGAKEIPPAVLDNALNLANLRLDVYADPQKVVDYLGQYYRDRGYLQARVNPPSSKLDPQTGKGATSIQIQEGPLFTIGDLKFSGNHAFNYDELWSVIPTSSGSSYDPNTLRDAVKALENTYHAKGYNDVAVSFRVVQDSAAARANLTFYINERRQSVIRDIVVEGTVETSKDFVRRQLDFQAGDVLDFAKVNESRRRLYSTAVYSSVDFQTEELPGRPAGDRTKDMRIRIRVREIRPYRLQYGLFYDTERGMGGLLEVEDRNFLGRASDLGMKFRYDTNLKEGRLYFHQPFVTKIHLKMDAGAFAQRETRTAFSANRVGFSLFQERQLPRSFRLDYGYRYDNVRWNGLPPDPTIFQASVPVARLVATLTRDSRDSVLDATRGEFSSHSLEFGPGWLGSEVGFARYYGQYFRYVPLDKFLLKPLSGKERSAGPARFVYAGALRLGLTSAFDGKSIISPERFFAGGGTTMRGFGQDKLGPMETLSDGTVRPFGGEALLLFNNEIRFPILGILHGVGFLDIGNVYPKISDFNFNIRKSAGAGLRLKIKFIPIRFDYGLKLDRRPGESAGEFFFSIGQAF